MKNFIWPMLLILLFLSSCGKNEFKTTVLDKSGGNFLIDLYEGGKEPVLEISLVNPQGSRSEADLTAGFVIKTAEYFRALHGNRRLFPEDYTIHISADTDYYRLFFSIGLNALGDVKNELLRYGLIQLGWHSVVGEAIKTQGPLTGRLSAEEYDFFKLNDIEGFFRTRIQNKQDIEQVYPYTVNYLLREILFVSMQEILSRPSRYLTFQELESIFSQVVILPEVTEFTGYLIQRFGKGKVLKVARMEYTADNWKKVLGEDIAETEGAFTKGIEKRIFSGSFADDSFRTEYDEFLKLYNKMTKPTLFKK